jgi:hypothetical protein
MARFVRFFSARSRCLGRHASVSQRLANCFDVGDPNEGIDAGEANWQAM